MRLQELQRPRYHQGDILLLPRERMHLLHLQHHLGRRRLGWQSQTHLHLNDRCRIAAGWSVEDRLDMRLVSAMQSWHVSIRPLLAWILRELSTIVVLTDCSVRVH